MAGKHPFWIGALRDARFTPTSILWVPLLLGSMACGVHNAPSTYVATAVPTMLGTPAETPPPTATPGFMAPTPTPAPVRNLARALPAAAGTSLYLAAAAHAAGSHGTNWRTDVGVHVIGHEDAVIDVELWRHGLDNSDPAHAELTLEAGRCVDIEDVLETEFGVAGKAALRITPNRGLVAVTSRTYNLLEEGNDLGLPAGATFGQFIPALLESAAIPSGEEGRLVQLSHDPGSDQGSRTNIGLVNASAAGLTVEIDLLSADGQLLGTVARQLQPYEYRQMDRIFESVTNSGVTDGYAVIRPITGGGAVMAYASIVDNLTGDPIAVIARPGSAGAGDPVYIVASAHVGGAAGTNWRTDLELHNGGSESIDCTIALLEHGQPNPSPQTASLSLPSGHSRRLTDVLVDLFGFSGQAALRITPDEPGLTVTSRTYNLVLEGNDLDLPPGATFGQYIAPVSQEDALSDGVQGRLIQLAEDDSSRTNLVLVNATSTPVTVEAELFADDGNSLGIVTRDLAPYEYRQLNRVFRMVTNGSIRAGYAVVRTSTQGGAFFALASVVDNITGDPVAVPAIRHRMGAPTGVFDAVNGMMDQLEQLEQSGISFEDIATAAIAFGTDGIINTALLVGPATLTRTDSGLRVDWGSDGVDGQGIPASGSAVLDMSNLSLNPAAITGSVSETYYGLQQDGHRPLTDRVSWSPEIDVGPGGVLAGPLHVDGEPFDPEVPGLATFSGSVEIDTAVCPYYPVGGSIEFEVDGQQHVVTFDPQCDGSFEYDGPGGDLSQFHIVTLRVLNLRIQLRFTDPDECGDNTFSYTTSFIWNAVNGSFEGRTYHDSWQVSDPPVHETQEVTLTVSPGSDRLSFTARETVVDSRDSEAVRTRTTTVSGQDVPTLFNGYSYETRIPGVGVCSYLTVEVEETNTATSCVKVLDTVGCGEWSGIFVEIR